MTERHSTTGIARSTPRRQQTRTDRHASVSRQRRRPDRLVAPATASEIAAEVMPSRVARLITAGVQSLLAERDTAAVPPPSERSRLADLLSPVEAAELVARLEIALERGYGLIVALATERAVLGTIGSLARHASAVAVRASGVPNTRRAGGALTR